jgi:WD40 repeat protein
MSRYTPLLSVGALLLALAPAAAQGDKDVTATSPDKNLFARAENAIITVADTATGKLLMKMRAHTDKVTALAYSPDGRLLASGSADKTFALWDGPTGKQLLQRRLNAAVVNLRFSSDGRTVVIREAGNNRREFDVATGQEVKPKQ